MCRGPRMPETVHFTYSVQPVIAFTLLLRREISSEVKKLLQYRCFL